MNKLKKYKILVAFLSFGLMGVANAQSNISPAEYLTDCETAGNSFTCNPETLSHNQAHSYCESNVRSEKNVGSEYYLQCMGSFVPFKSDGNTNSSCNIEAGEGSVNWMGGIDSNTGEFVGCVSSVPAGSYTHLERVEVEHNEALLSESRSHEYSGEASFICRNGQFYVDSTSSNCTQVANSCTLEAGSEYVWPANRVGAYEYNAGTQEFIHFDTNDTINLSDTDWNGRESELIDLLNDNSCVFRNPSDVEFDTFDRVYIRPNQDSKADNLIGTGSFNFAPVNVYNGSITGGDSTGSLWNNLDTHLSYQIDYCYDGEINTAESRDRLERTTSGLVNAGLITSNRANSILAKNCSVHPADCEGYTVSNTTNGLNCPFELNDTRHGSDPLFGNTVNLPSVVEFSSEGTHGTGAYSCFNGEMNTSLNCYVSPACEVNTVEAQVDSEFVEVDFDYGTFGNSYTESQLRTRAEDEIIDYCSNRDLGIESRFDMSSFYYNAEEYTYESSNEWVTIESENYTGTGAQECDAIDREIQQIIDESGADQIGRVSGSCSVVGQTSAYSEYSGYSGGGFGSCDGEYEINECQAVGDSGDEPDNAYNIKANGMCDFVEEESFSDSDLCESGNPTNLDLVIQHEDGVNFKGTYYEWTCESGLLDRSCASAPNTDGSGIPPTIPVSCFECQNGYAFNSTNGQCEEDTNMQTEVTSISYNCQSTGGMLSLIESQTSCSDDIMDEINSSGYVLSSSVLVENRMCVDDYNNNTVCADYVLSTENVNEGGDSYDVCVDVGSNYEYNATTQQCEHIEFGASASFGQCESTQPEENEENTIGTWQNVGSEPECVMGECPSCADYRTGSECNTESDGFTACAATSSADRPCNSPFCYQDCVAN